MRIAKRGNRYEYLTSTDGKSFQSHGEVEWGDGSPKQIGILAKNGGSKDASELDANFEFFELRAPAPPRTEPDLRKTALHGSQVRRESSSTRATGGVLPTKPFYFLSPSLESSVSNCMILTAWPGKRAMTSSWPPIASI